MVARYSHNGGKEEVTRYFIGDNISLSQNKNNSYGAFQGIEFTWLMKDEIVSYFRATL